jgi:hypothetical protein
MYSSFYINICNFTLQLMTEKIAKLKIFLCKSIFLARVLKIRQNLCINISIRSILFIKNFKITCPFKNIFQSCAVTTWLFRQPNFRHLAQTAGGAAYCAACIWTSYTPGWRAFRPWTPTWTSLTWEDIAVLVSCIKI